MRHPVTVARVLLAFALVPVLIVVGHAPVAAAEETGWASTTVPVQVELGQDASCWITAQYGGSERSEVVWGAGECIGGPDLSPFESQFGEPGSALSMQFRGVNQDGGACLGGAGMVTLGEHSEDSFWAVSGSIPAGSSILAPAGCNVTQVCFTPSLSHNPGESCGSITLPQVTTVPDVCPAGTPIFADYSTATAAEPWGADGYHIDLGAVEWRGLVLDDTITFPDDADTYGDHAGNSVMSYRGWEATLWARNAGGGLQMLGYAATYLPGHYLYNDYNNTWTVPGTRVRFQYDDVDAPANLPHDIVGVQISTYYDPTDLGNVGKTIPELCSFWIGEKVYDDPLSDEDDPHLPLSEPVGGGGTPPPPPPGGGGPETPEDEGGFWDMMAKALAAIAKAIVGIAGAVVEGITDMLKSLLVPSPGFLDGKVQEAKDAWADTPPLVVVDGLGDLGDALTIPEPTGCQGPALNVTTPFTGPLELHPLSACSEEVALLASIIKTALTASVYVGAFLAAVRMIGSALGLDMNIAKGME